MANPEVLVPNNIDYDFGRGNVMQVGRIFLGENGAFAAEPMKVDISVERYDELGMGIPQYGSAEFVGQYKQKLVEIRDNLEIIEDPQTGDTFEITIVNKDILEDGVGAVVQISTSNSTIPDNPGNAIELAQNAVINPNRAIIYVASPGNGGSISLTDEELLHAKQDGLLVQRSSWQGLDSPPPAELYEAFPTIQALARALGTLDDRVTHLSSDASGAHYSSALMTALPEGQLEAAFLYNPTNISSLSALGYKFRMLKEIATQGRYGDAAERMAVTSERIDEARQIMGKDFGAKATQLRSGTFRLSKMMNEAQIYRGGWAGEPGKAAKTHLTIGLSRQPDAKVTYAFPEFSANYKRPNDIAEFMRSALDIGGFSLDAAGVEGYKLPVGQYWHSHHPFARLALQDEAFNR